MPSMTEREVMRVFNGFKRHYIKKLGRRATNDRQLTAAGKQAFGRKYVGTFSQDNTPWRRLPKKCYMIANIDLQGRPGVHWVALYRNNNMLYIYDSFGRPSSQLIPVLLKQAKHNLRARYKDSHGDAEQRGSSAVCGQLCLAWLSCVEQLGIRAAMHI